MKIKDARQAYSEQLNTLWSRRQTLAKLLKEEGAGGAASPAFDRVEISRELSRVDAQYDAVQGIMEGITARETAIHNAETARQQGEAMAEATDEMIKMMEVYRRIASGGKVPPEDERRLMEYNHELYMAAKSAALLAQQEGEEYDSLWQDEEETGGEEKSAGEIAGDTEISVPAPETAAAAASAESPQ